MQRVFAAITLVFVFYAAATGQTSFNCQGGTSPNTYSLTGSISHTVTQTGGGNCQVNWSITYNKVLNGTWWSAQAGLYCGGSQANFVHSAYPTAESNTWQNTFYNVPCANNCELRLSMMGPSGTSSSTCATVALFSLPIELASFTAKGQDRAVLLEWETHSESDNKGFEVERRSGFGDWEPIGWIDGAGDATSKNHYTFQDDSPLPGINYYRLRQSDFDGDFEYSNVAFAEVKSDPTLLFAPNPARDILVVYGTEEITSISIFDVYGKVIYNNLPIENNEINIADIPVGTYFISAISSNRQLNFKFQKI